MAELKARAANGDHKAAGGVPAAENAVAEARQALQSE